MLKQYLTSPATSRTTYREVCDIADMPAPSEHGKSAIHPEYARIGAALKNAREMKGWSQREAGRRLGVSGASISQLENAEVQTPLGALIEYARIVGAPLTVLVAAPEDTRARMAHELVELLTDAPPSVAEMIEELLPIWRRKTDEERRRKL